MGFQESKRTPSTSPSNPGVRHEFPPLALSFTEARRRRLAKKVDRLDRLESRTTITEPISFTGLALSAIAGDGAARVHVPERR